MVILFANVNGMTDARVQGKTRTAFVKNIVIRCAKKTDRRTFAFYYGRGGVSETISADMMIASSSSSE